MRRESFLAKSQHSVIHKPRSYVDMLISRTSAARYDKLAAHFLGSVKLASIMLWLNCYDVASLPRTDSKKGERNAALPSSFGLWIRGAVQPRLWRMVRPRLRRVAPPTAPKPAIIIAQVAGSGTAPDGDPAGMVPVGVVVMGL